MWLITYHQHGYGSEIKTEFFSNTDDLKARLDILAASQDLYFDVLVWKKYEPEYK